MKIVYDSHVIISIFMWIKLFAQENNKENSEFEGERRKIEIFTYKFLSYVVSKCWWKTFEGESENLFGRRVFFDNDLVNILWLLSQNVYHNHHHFV